MVMYINSTSDLSEVTILIIQFEESNTDTSEDQLEEKLCTKKIFVGTFVCV